MQEFKNKPCASQTVVGLLYLVNIFIRICEYLIFRFQITGRSYSIGKTNSTSSICPPAVKNTTSLNSKKTAPNQIVSIERIQNRERYMLYNLKRLAKVNKYGSNLTGKELMLFHGTSSEYIERINAGGLNSIYAGVYGKMYSDFFFILLYCILNCLT
jgi:hypothetical protein